MDGFYPRQPINRGRRTPLLGGILFGLVGGWLLTTGVGGWTQPVTVEPRSVTPRGELAPEEKSNIELFEQVSPSVVYITSVARRRDFFGLNVFEIPQGTGSGFVWDEAGHIVTNFHVILNADALEVTLADHTSWKARIVGSAPDKDLAVLRINAPRKRLHPIPIGTSKDLKVGQKVFAIGNPFGLDQTLTTGIVSALGRSIKSVNSRTIDNVIQTDAAINPGNSGGPLLDSAGRLIGVNTQIVSPSGANSGIGFAVPVDTVVQVVPQLIQHGRVMRPYLGIELVPDNYVRRWGLRGVLVKGVRGGTAADKAGLQGLRFDRRGDIILGDLIVKLGQYEVASTDDLLSALEHYKPGDTVSLTFIRNEKKRTVKITLQEPPD